MGYVVKIPLLVGTEVTEHTHALARALMSVELGRPVEAVYLSGSVIVDPDPLVVWHTFVER